MLRPRPLFEQSLLVCLRIASHRPTFPEDSSTCHWIERTIPFEIRSGTCFILYRCGDALQVRAARAGPGRNRGRAPGRPVAEHCPDMARIMIFAGLDDLAVTDFMHKGMPVVVNGADRKHTRMNLRS